MPNTSVNPSASNAYCAPRLTPMIEAWTNSAMCVARAGRLHRRLDPHHALVLAVLDDADAEWKHQFLCDAELLLAAPESLADIRVIDRQLAQRRRHLFHIGGRSGVADRLQGHARTRQIGP